MTPYTWFDIDDRRTSWEELRRQALVGLDYQSPNLMPAHKRQLNRRTTASDQEGVATLVLSGTCLGFLIDHYAEPFVRAGRMRAVAPTELRYQCLYSCVHRREPGLSRVAEVLLYALRNAHHAASP